MKFDFEATKKAFTAGQYTAFREQVAIWVRDETISNENFAMLVSGLEWDMAMNRTAFLSELSSMNAVDTDQADGVE